jgi:hypothetical protein
MTRRTSARVAGFTYLFYIVVGVTGLLVGRGATAGEGTAAKLASIAQHAPQVRADLVLGVVTSFTALALAVALYGITRDEDQELAVLALACRVAEGVLPGISILATLGLLWLGTAAGANAADAAAARALGALLLQVRGWNTTIGATFFAAGSTVFSWLLLRGRMIPAPLAWLGVLGSVLLVVGLPLQLAGLLHSPVTQLIWLPVAAFELTLGPWLLIKGVPSLRPKLPDS